MAKLFSKKLTFFLPIISVKSDVLNIWFVLEDPVGVVDTVLPLVGLGRLLGRAQELRHLLQLLVEGETVLDQACSSFSCYKIKWSTYLEWKGRSVH